MANCPVIVSIALVSLSFPFAACLHCFRVKELTRFALSTDTRSSCAACIFSRAQTDHSGDPALFTISLPTPLTWSSCLGALPGVAGNHGLHSLVPSIQMSATSGSQVQKCALLAVLVFRQGAMVLSKHLSCSGFCYRKIFLYRRKRVV